MFQTFIAGLAGSWDIIRLLEINSGKTKCWWFKKIIQEQMDQIYFQSHELKYEWLTKYILPASKNNDYKY